MFCIVDIETTGGRAKQHKIIEIGACLHDGSTVVDRFHSYVNPQQHIPPFITRLTGITDEMVEDAPVFEELAEELYDFLDGHIFVAHNVSFDYNFIKAHFAEVDIQFNQNRLCTVRLSRKIIPGQASYSLGTLCQSLKINIKGRHTALGDAEATATLFSLLVQLDKNGVIEKSAKRNSRESLLPPNLDKQVFDQLPEKQGIYYFLDKKGKPLYIGKSKNIKSRITGHFSTGSSSREKIRFMDEIYAIETRLCPNDLIMDLTECHEIKKHWPRHNREFKKRANSYGVYQYIDARGFVRYHVNKVMWKSKPLLVFSDYSSAYQYVKDLCLQHQLCPKLCGLQKAEHECMLAEDGSCENACRNAAVESEYKYRSRESLEHIMKSKETFILVGNGFEHNEKSVVLVENGKYLGFGLTTQSVAIDNFENLKLDIEPRKPTQDIDNILYNYIAKLEHAEELLV
ncbi:DNA polymerase III subunit epsilon [bacterium]|nr:DNA polymerase III subunit epsilon [bacterium]